MTKIEEAQQILEALGLAKAQRNEMAALTLLALAGLRPTDPWASTSQSSMTVTKGIMGFVAHHYDRNYAPNTRETFRRQVLHQLVQAGAAELNPDNPDLATNSPNTHYRLSGPAARVLKSYGARQWPRAVERFRAETLLRRPSVGQRPSVTLPSGQTVTLSPGAHNSLEAKVLTLFRETFVPSARVLYVGDAANKLRFEDNELIAELGLALDEHGKLPDIVLYDRDRDCLYLIEAVTSHGPVTPKRVLELQPLFAGKSLVFVSAFPDLAAFKKFVAELAWDTEVWIAEVPDHMIHFNGDRFLEPR